MTSLGFSCEPQEFGDKATLPHKVWNECMRCPKFAGCGEIAVVRDLVALPRPVELPVF